MFVVCMSISTDHRTLLYTFAECHNETAQLHNRFVRGSSLKGPTLIDEVPLHCILKSKQNLEFKLDIQLVMLVYAIYSVGEIGIHVHKLSM